jgi:hypothetical protein
MKVTSDVDTARVLRAARRLYDLGYWIVPIRAKGEVIRKKNPRFGKDPDQPEFLEKVTKGKEPIGFAWGAKRRDWAEIERTIKAVPARGYGIVLGPSRGPGETWLIDVEGDGPDAEASWLELCRGEIVETIGHRSRRGIHRFLVVDGERLLGLLAQAGGKPVKDKPGVYHLPALPGLELRVSSLDPKGVVKQLQSVGAPCPGEDGKPRTWLPGKALAALPESSYTWLASIEKPRDLRPFGRKALAQEAAQFAAKPPGERHGFLLESSNRLASLVKAGALEEREALEELRSAARANHLADEPGREHEVDELWDSAMARVEPRNIPGPSANGEGRAYPHGPVAAPEGEAPRDEGTGPDPDGETHAVALLRLAAVATLFHDRTGRTYAAAPIDGHVEVHEIRSTGFRRWLKRLFYLEAGRPPAAQALQDALGVLDARAMHDGPEEEVFVRVAGRGDRIYIDLGDANWRAVEVDAADWRIVAAPPVRFRRANGMRPLPEPARGGTLDRLKDFVNVEDGELVLLIAWLVAAMRPSGPYPVLVLTGEQGSAKSTLARLARLLLDPHVSPLRSEPKEPRDLMIGAVNGWVIALDNVSAISSWLSDALCRLSTGGGLATRSLYTNDEETFLDAMRAAVLTGITDFVNRGDLVDRSLFLHLGVIAEEKRRTEGEFWRDFEAAAPQLFGALLDALSGGLRLLPEVKLTALPRMADFALFGEAVSRALGNPPDTFLDAYRKNRKEANESVVEGNPVAGAVRELASRGEWTGTATELLVELTAIVGERVAQSKDWPKSGRGMSGAIRRLAPSLRMVGIPVDFGERTEKARPITIRLAEREGIRPSSPSGSSSAPDSRDKPHDGRNGQPSSTVSQPSCVSSPKTGCADSHDGHDGPIPTHSANPGREVFEI